MEISPELADGQVPTLTEATGLALEIAQGFENRVTVIPSKYKLRVLGLGPTEVYLDGRMLVPSDWTFAKPKELLYYLISNPLKTKEQIGLVFWPDASPDQLRTSLRAALYHLRRALGERSWVFYEDGYYKFNRSMDHWYDVEAFERSLESAERSAQDEEAIEQLDEGVSLYRGDFLSDLANDEWGTLRREELRSKYLKAMSLLGELLVKSSAYDRAIGVYRSLLSTDLLMEEAHRALMRCYIQKGERALALRQYQTLVEILQDELGASPSSETTVLYQSIQ
jgi:DNA-binding SARP family transcriptional activator